jgi:hypothetical protein
LIRLFKILQGILFDTMGGIATSCMLICIASGAFLAVPYNVTSPLDSVSLMLLDNPAAALLRNIHYWSAQFFLVFTILHLVDHFIQKTEYNVSRGGWIRLTLSIPVLFFAMISGFILKGDADAISAFTILSSLIERIPLVGGLLKSTLMGSGNNLELVYVHHIATATIVLFIVLYEHSRKVWPGPAGFIILLFVLLLFGFFLHAPLGDESGKGPWYFIGFQEILHWFSRPGWAWILILTGLVIIWFMPRVNLMWNAWLKKLLLLFFTFYILASIAGTFFRGENWLWKWPWEGDIMSGNLISFHPVTLKTAEDIGFKETIPLVNGYREGCLVCHDNVVGIEDAHNPSALGCRSCHGGNPFTLDKDLAHREMNLNPGNLADAPRSCGTAACHADIPKRVANSIMSTMSGVVTVDRFVFGQSKSLNSLAHIKDIGHSAADQHLRDLCANCHLGHMKTDPGSVTQQSRGGGCNACHLNYSDSAKVSLTLAKARLKEGVFYHPQLNLTVSDEHCFGCHSRSGRIALTYEGWQETLLEKENIPSDGMYKVLDDQRVLKFIREDVHLKAGMACIDCHISTELMGDEKLYAHKEEQVRIKCEDCHFINQTNTKVYQDLDIESKKIIAQRKWQVSDLQFITGTVSGQAITNAWIDKNGQALLRVKTKDTFLVLRPPTSACTSGKSHQSLSCESCHTSWVPQCIGCHNIYNPEIRGFDLLDYKEKKGSWEEHVGLFIADQPTLGIIENKNGSKQVMTFTPGMVISIDTSSYNSNDPGKAYVFRRLFAPASAHTTVKKGRDCKSCHLDPLAIGYGRGELVFEIDGNKGKWVFRSRFALNEYDRLPEDAWIGFLEDPAGFTATRANARPFNLKEQQAILTAGACLVCHPEDSEMMKESLVDFPLLLKKVTEKCVLPEWN